MLQLQLFPEPTEEIQERKILELEERHEKLRKSLHARNSMLQKEVKELRSEVEFLKGHICKGGFLL